MFDHLSIQLVSAARKEGYRAVRDAIRSGEKDPVKIRVLVEAAVRDVLKNVIIDPEHTVNEIMALFSMVGAMIAVTQ